MRPASLCAALLVTTALAADDKPRDAAVPKEVRALAGTYAGAWAMYGVDDKGDVVKRMAWTDVVTAEAPQVQGDRAFVTITNVMTFEGGKAPPFTVKGKEGFFLTKDGGLGDAFVETFGPAVRMVKLGDNVWSYATPAAAQELSRLGFSQGATGQHVVVKVVVQEQGVETHRITRVTTATWKDKDGKERTLQFVSLQGHHKRKP
jgi:hypothetical protein